MKVGRPELIAILVVILITIAIGLSPNHNQDKCTCPKQLLTTELKP